MWLLEPSRQLAFQFLKRYSIDYMVTWQAGKPAVWDVTVTWTTAPSYLDSSSREAGAAAEMAASRKSKMANYSNLAAQHTLL